MRDDAADQRGIARKFEFRFLARQSRHLSLQAGALNILKWSGASNLRCDKSQTLVQQGLEPVHDRSEVMRAAMIEEHAQLLPLAEQDCELAELSFPRVDGLGCVRVRTSLSRRATSISAACWSSIP